ncbi:response regulator transcription factor [bacterium]|nr:response regulator transcription factor [candidate division CSSED10-310 bacterium]
MKIRLLLADDHEVVRSGLGIFLEQHSDIEIIGMSGNGLETLQKVQELKPDLVLMDINMPNLNGIEVTRQIKNIMPDVKILTLSVHTRDIMVSRMIEAGASGYLPKSCAGEELIQAIHAVMNHHTYISPKVMDSVVEYLHDKSNLHVSSTCSLTKRERQVLCLIGEGKSNKEIANCLNLSEKTIESHRYQIMHKLNIHHVAGLIKYAIREGITSLEIE